MLDRKILIQPDNNEDRRFSSFGEKDAQSKSMLGSKIKRQMALPPLSSLINRHKLGSKESTTSQMKQNSLTGLELAETRIPVNSDYTHRTEQAIKNPHVSYASINNSPVLMNNAQPDICVSTSVPSFLNSSGIPYQNYNQHGRQIYQTDSPSSSTSYTNVNNNSAKTPESMNSVSRQLPISPGDTWNPSTYGGGDDHFHIIPHSNGRYTFPVSYNTPSYAINGTTYYSTAPQYMLGTPPGVPHNEPILTPLTPPTTTFFVPSGYSMNPEVGQRTDANRTPACANLNNFGRNHLPEKNAFNSNQSLILGNKRVPHVVHSTQPCTKIEPGDADTVHSCSLSSACTHQINDSKATDSSSTTKKKTNKELNREKSLARRTCPICHKVCSRPSTLKTHMLIHTGALPYKCPYPNCNKRFNVKSNLTRHIRSRHKFDTLD